MYLCLTHDWLHSMGGSKKSRKCKTKTKPERIINEKKKEKKKKMFLVQTSLLHYVS